MKEAPKGYLPTLDGWRAIAILLVCITHGFDAVFGPGAPNANEALHHWTRFGAKGVDLFFGISGFLICSRLLEEYDARGRISLKGFYIRRFARILPPYFLFLLVIGALCLAGAITVGTKEFVSSVFFLRNYVAPGPGGGWYTGHLWSLAVEEHFYLLLPGLLVLWRPKRAGPWLVAMALGLAFWRSLEFRQQWLGSHLPGVSAFERTDMRLDALLWGCVMALLLRSPATRERIVRLLTPATWAIVVTALVAVIVLSPPLALLWQSILIPIVLAGTVLHPGSPPGRLLELPPLRWIGRISYSLYLWQQLFLVGWGLALPFGAWQRLPLSLVAVFACAALSYYAVERPFIKLGHRLAPPTTEGRV